MPLLLVELREVIVHNAGSKSKGSASMSSEDDVLDHVVMPPDLPLEAIAEEVQNSWHLKVLPQCMSTSYQFLS